LGNEQTKVCIIGAGPAGLMAAIFSASSATGKAGARTIVIEANKSPGQKLLLTGAGRCNLTHQATPKELVRAFGDKGNPSSAILRRVKFLSFSLHRFSSQYIQDFFVQLGLRLRLEKDGCVFPATNRAGDVRDVLFTEAKKLGVRFIFSAKVQSITKHGDYFTIEFNPSPYRRRLNVDKTEKVIIATGGLSYPDTGSTGDGYKFAQHLGHTIIEPRASLVPLVTLEKWPGELAGTSLDNVKITASFSRKKIVTTGALLFTHDGIGGPAVLDMSQLITDFLPNEKNPIKISIDLVGNIDETAIEKVILKQIGEHPKKTVANILVEIVPRHIAQILCWLLDLPENLPANQLNKDIRKKLLHLLKATPLSIVRTRPIAEATVTRGGVSTTEIESKTMESKICRGLYFAGEVIDVDGPCGGYNLQMCWSTGALAGISAGQTTPSNAGG
jgi:predicted Rossmann fold flavoprotein